MKKTVAELLKLVHSTGLKTGLQAFYRKNGTSPAFSLYVPAINSRITIRRKTSDWSVFKQVFVWKEYNYPIPFKVNTMIDAGANVGYASLWFRSLFPGASIVAIEPESSNFDALEANTAPYANISRVKAGLWSRSCYLRIINENKGNWAFRTEEVEEAAEDTIRAVTISQLMQEKGWDTIDLLKIDIEGAEKEVFRQNFESWLPKTKMIFIELHDHLDKNCSKALFNALAKHDFSVDISGENLVLINNQYR